MSRPDPGRVVDRFLKTGDTGSIPLSELAAACSARVRAETQKSNRRALALGARFVEQARPHGGDLYATALRARGWAELVAGNYGEAEACYLEARALLRKDPLARARIDRVLIDVYMYLGRADEAGRRARRALAVFDRLKAEADIAKTWVNYANVLHRQDRHEEAGTLYRKAAEFFTRTGIEPAVALCYYNLANTRVQLFDFEEAESLYHRARALFERVPDPLHAIGCLYGLAWLHMLAGEFDGALRELAECEDFYRKGNQQRELTLCLLDRAETYLALNLFIDARRCAEQAGRRARSLKLRYETAKAALFAGRAALGLGRRGDARRRLRNAAEGFAAERNRGFAAATELSLAQTARRRADRRQHLDTARRGFDRAHLPLWQAICDLHLLSDGLDDSRLLRRLADNRAVRTVPHLYAGWHTLRGDLEARRRRWPRARRHWTRAADALDAVRAKLPPVEMRSAYMRNQPDPFGRLIASEYARRPLRAAAWSERCKTAGIWAATEELVATSPERRRIEESLSRLAGRVAAHCGLMGKEGGRRGGAGATPARVTSRDEQELRNRLAELGAGPGAVPETTESAERQLTAESEQQPVLQFHVGRRDVLAFVHYRGESRAHCYVDGTQTLDRLVGLWRFQIECASYAPEQPSAHQLRDEQDVLRRIGDWLLPPLELPARAGRLLVIPEGPLVSLPWLALPRAGVCLADDYDVVLAPSLRHFIAARRQSTRSRTTRVFVGTRDGLTHVDAELDAIRFRLGTRSLLCYDPCRRDDWPGAGESRVWHFTGHASLRADNPFYSALHLQDGPLFAADLRMRRHRVALVTLAACRTGQHTSLPGEESTGLVRSLLEMGARNVIASHWAIADRSTARWTDALYESYLGGAGAARAVRRAAQEVRETHPAVYHWGAFAVYGCG